MQMPGRNSNVGNYRYGYTGKEVDPEMKGNGNSYGFGNRDYDPRLGRWMSLDPMKSMYPSMSPYCYAGNMPIGAKDPDGNWIIFVNGYVYGPLGVGEGYACPPLRAYWYSNYDKAATTEDGGIADSPFISAAKEYFKDDNAHYINGTGYSIDSEADERFEAGRQYVRDNVVDLYAQLCSLGPDEKMEFVTHSMGAAFAEGMIAELMEYEEFHGRITTVVHLSACDARDIEIAANTAGIKRIQLTTQGDMTLNLADFWTFPHNRYISNVNIYGFMYWSVFAYHGKWSDKTGSAKWDSHFDTKVDERVFNHWLPALEKEARELGPNADEDFRVNLLKDLPLDSFKRIKTNGKGAENFPVHEYIPSESECETECEH